MKHKKEPVISPNFKNRSCVSRVNAIIFQNKFINSPNVFGTGKSSKQLVFSSIPYGRKNSNQFIHSN